MLVYPEISDNEELEELTQMFEQVEKFFLEEGKKKCWIANLMKKLNFLDESFSLLNSD